MFSRELHPFSQTLQSSHDWMTALMEELGTDDPQQAYRVLRASLRTLRDRLTADEAADLAAQLPMLMRGLFFDGFKPSHQPDKTRHRDAFLQRISEELQAGTDPDAETAFQAVFVTLERCISEGEATDVRSMLPGELRELLPEPHEVH